MTNKYPGKCLFCGKYVEAGNGYFQRKLGALKRRFGAGWAIRCKSCVGSGNQIAPKENNSPFKTVDMQMAVIRKAMGV